ncbi:MAG: organic solvent tolerance protein OstA [Cloacibacterium sp.]|nr:organic solvent tolerance protein OstA [Cloacibacterium sp.]
MRKFFLFFGLLVGMITVAQVDPLNSKQNLVKDPYFRQNTNTKTTSPAQKVKVIHADLTQKMPNMFKGNTFMSGSVHLEHQGSTLKADTVVFYQEENFVKAIGNVELLTSDGNRITSGEMEYDGNTQRGIARKNVILTDPKQTIKTETLYYDRIPNTAYFNTGGTITDGSGTMYSKVGTYYINEKRTDFSGNYTINNAEYLVEGSNIKQYANTNTAEFFGPTTVTNKKNPQNYVYTEKGKYLMTSKEVYLNKNSKIYYNGKVLLGDAMYYNQNTGFGKAEGNVTLKDPKEKRYIKGGYGEIYEKKDSTMITKNPYAVKILEKDSMYFAAEKFLTFQKLDEKEKVKKSFLRAFHKARMFKSNAQARADSLSFNETDGILHLVRKPFLWSGEKQVSGDEIKAFFDTKKENIDSLKVIGNAFAISKVDSLNRKDEFNQVKGRYMSVYYKDNEISLAKVIGNAQAITYADSEDEKTKEVTRIGIALSTCGEIDALFEERRVQIIACNIGANSDIYPMSQIAPEKRKFPDFNWNTKDRLRKWKDIFLDTPNYEEIQYETDASLFEKAEKERKKLEEKNKPKTIKRTRK